MYAVARYMHMVYGGLFLSFVGMLFDLTLKSFKVERFKIVESKLSAISYYFILICVNGDIGIRCP